VESKWKNFHIITFPGQSLPETETNSRCFLWRQNNLEVNYSPIWISGGKCFYRRHHMIGVTGRTTKGKALLLAVTAALIFVS
jgi:hypothetical protein